MKQERLHTLTVRIWHWANLLIMMMLIVTGVWLRLKGIAALKPHDPVLVCHRYTGYAMAVATAFWIAHTLTSGNQRRHYRLGRRDIRGLFPQMRYYAWSIFSGAENPFEASVEHKYNPLQKMAYGTFMFFLLPAQVLTGLLFLDIPVVRPYLLANGLIGPMDAVHVALTYLIILYLIIHLYMATLGDTVLTHTRAMITGHREHGKSVPRRRTQSTSAGDSLERTAE
jgi:thiosulfate reductase cytochrome b subunit